MARSRMSGGQDQEGRWPGSGGQVASIRKVGDQDQVAKIRRAGETKIRWLGSGSGCQVAGRRISLAGMARPSEGGS